LRNDVRNAPAIDGGFRIKGQQSGAEFRAKRLIQVRPPVQSLAQRISFRFGTEFGVAARVVGLAAGYSSFFIRRHSETAAFAPDFEVVRCFLPFRLFIAFTGLIWLAGLLSETSAESHFRPVSDFGWAPASCFPNAFRSSRIRVRLSSLAFR
jgi:hypothetical protein